MVNRIQNALKIKRILQSEGFGPMAIAASLARMNSESAFNPNARNKGDGSDGSDSVGLLQWNSDRGRRLQQFSKEMRKRNPDISDLEIQTRYYAAEVKGKTGAEGPYGKLLLAAQTPQAAAEAAISMARPQGWTPRNPSAGLGFGNTLKLTKQFASGTFPGFRAQRDRLTTDTGATAAGGGADEVISDTDKALAELNKVDVSDWTISGGDSRMDPAGSDLAPIDNSPEGRLKQIFTGLGSILGKAGTGAEKPTSTASTSMFDSVKNSGPHESPMVDQIKGMIRGFV